MNSTLLDWKSPDSPRRAGVTALGAGGTNCHLILEEASEPHPAGGSRPLQLFTLSAKTPEALREYSANLAGFLKESPDVNLADAAFTLSTGRKGFEVRRFAVAASAAEAAAILSGESGVTKASVSPSVVFLFTGQGAQYVGMARELYEQEASFKEVVDQCAAILKPEIGADLRELLSSYAAADPVRLTQTAMAQPALFIIEYAMAKLWMSWGVKPAAMLGHSVGEYVAACLAGVFPLEDALRLVAARITGGLGGIALELARFLAGSYQARLALFARTTLPPRGDWQAWLSSHAEDHEISRKMRAILDCERQGAEVLVLPGDVCDPLQMAARYVEELMQVPARGSLSAGWQVGWRIGRLGDGPAASCERQSSETAGVVRRSTPRWKTSTWRSAAMRPSDMRAMCCCFELGRNLCST